MNFSGYYFKAINKPSHILISKLALRFIAHLIFISLSLYSFSANAKTWKFENLSLGSEQDVLVFSAQAIQSPLIENSITQIKYRCKTSATIYPKHQCNNGEVSFIYDGLAYQYLMSGWFDVSKNTWDIILINKQKTMEFSSRSTAIDTIGIKLNKMPTDELATLVSSLLKIDKENTTAFVSAEITIELSNAIVIDADYQLQELSWESEDGDYVLADNQIKGSLQLWQTNTGTHIDLTTVIEKGEGLFKDIYVLFDENPLTLKTDVTLNNYFEPIKTQFQMQAGDDISILVEIFDWASNKMKVSFDVKDLGKLYQGFLASYLEIIGINDLEVIGKAQGHVELEREIFQAVTVDFSDLYLAIDSKKINVVNLNGAINWQQKGQMQASKLHWEELLLAGMPINQSELNVNSVGQELVLQKNTVIPIFDGSILINELALHDIFEPEIAINFDGEVNPISLALITEKMGWPVMNGTISGKIPGMKKVGQSITFDGSLDLTIFDGTMQVNNLSMERLLGVAPVIAADIQFNGLSLKQITSTFDFGEITGLVQGYVKALRITNWKADRLNAHIESVKVRGVKQTISQRAIDNISSIGGIQGALSRSFLRFFEYFKYKKIGIGCKLRNSICEMSGINTNSDTYTLIQGYGIPRINFIGFRRFIDWEIFLDRLLNAGY
jgi:hypothetical protein